MSATLRGIQMTSLTAFPDCLWRIRYLPIWKHPNASVCLFPRFGFHFISQLYSQRDPRWLGNFQFHVSDSHLVIASPSFTLFSKGFCLAFRSPCFDSWIWVKWSIDPIWLLMWSGHILLAMKNKCGNLARRSIGFHVFHASMLEWRVCPMWIYLQRFTVLCLGCFGFMFYFVCVFICLYIYIYVWSVYMSVNARFLKL